MTVPVQSLALLICYCYFHIKTAPSHHAANLDQEAGCELSEDLLPSSHVF